MHDCGKVLRKRGVMVSPSVQTSDAVVTQIQLQPVHVLPEDSPTNGVLVVLADEPHPLDGDLFLNKTNIKLF